MEAKRPRRRFGVAKMKFSVGQLERISKEKNMFAKGSEQKFSIEIFRIANSIERRLQPVYELDDLNETPIDGQFYQEEQTPVRVSKQTA